MVSEEKFIEASRDGDLGLVKQYIIEGGDIGVVDKNNWGYTALMQASRNGRTEIVRCLVGAGVDVGMKNGYGNTAHMIASINGHVEIVKIIKDLGMSRPTRPSLSIVREDESPYSKVSNEVKYSSYIFRFIVLLLLGEYEFVKVSIGRIRDINTHST